MLLFSKSTKLISVIILAVAPLLAWSDEKNAAKLNQPDLNYDEVDPRDWGIRNGCIRTSQIESFSYVSPKTAKLELSHNRAVIMTFKNRCTGLNTRGVVYKTRTGELCARFDHVTVLDYRTVCMIESIEPFLGLEEPEQADE